MPEIRLTEDQLERLEAVTADVEAAYVGRYGRATTADAVDYLLDTYTPPSEREGDADARSTTASSNGASANGAAKGNGTADGKGESESDDEASSNGEKSAKPQGGDSPLAAVAALLEDNDDVWRKSDGDAPYEVDLPDGSTEGVRTKDDVKRLLFKHYR